MKTITKRAVLFTLSTVLLVSCNHLGSSKVKNLVDLTSKIEIEDKRSLKFPQMQMQQSIASSTKTKSYNIADNIIITEPVIVGNTLYSIDSKGFVYAYLVKEKKILWKLSIAKGSVDKTFNGGGIAYNNNRLYVTNGSRYLTIIDTTNGHKVLSEIFPDVLKGKPVIVDGRTLVTQTASNQTIAYDITKSKFLWIHESSPESLTIEHHSGLVIYKNCIVANYNSGLIVLLDIDSGAEKWYYNFRKIGEAGLPNFDPYVVVNTPVVCNEYGYFATSNGELIKIDLDTGIPVWTKNIADIQSVDVIGQYLLITNNARQIAALSIHDGKILWVGELISQNERSNKKVSTVTFQKPFITQENNVIIINVIASNGELYQFKQNSSGDFDNHPIIVKIVNNVAYYHIIHTINKVALITARSITY